MCKIEKAIKKGVSTIKIEKKQKKEEYTHEKKLLTDLKCISQDLV